MPDIYQGDEIWNLALVDPDNRRPVDFARRRRLLEELDAAEGGPADGSLIDTLVSRPSDGRLKLFVTRRLLQVRRAHPEFFVGADYQPLGVAGVRSGQVIAFARQAGDSVMVVVVPRLTTAGGAGPAASLGPAFWEGTTVALPPEWADTPFACALSGAVVAPSGGTIPMAASLARLPAAVLLATGS